jgi:hypothetical protein
MPQLRTTSVRRQHQHDQQDDSPIAVNPTHCTAVASEARAHREEHAERRQPGQGDGAPRKREGPQPLGWAEQPGARTRATRSTPAMINTRL